MSRAYSHTRGLVCLAHASAGVLGWQPWRAQPPPQPELGLPWALRPLSSANICREDLPRPLGGSLGWSLWRRLWAAWAACGWEPGSVGTGARWVSTALGRDSSAGEKGTGWSDTVPLHGSDAGGESSQLGRGWEAGDRDPQPRDTRTSTEWAQPAPKAGPEPCPSPLHRFLVKSCCTVVF